MNAEEFIKYLDNEMSPDEKEKFESVLNENIVYKKELKTVQEMRAFAKDQAAQENALQVSREVHAEYQNRSKTTNKTNLEEKAKSTNKFGIIKYLIPIAVAALFLIGFFGLNIFSSDNLSHDQIYAEYFRPAELSLVVRSEDKQQIEKEAELNFNQKEFQTAYSKLEELLIKKPNDKRVQLYHAITGIELNDHEQARSQLQKLATNEDYADESYYFIALSYLKTNNNYKAIESLQLIKSESYRFAAAQDIIKLLTQKK